MLLCIMLVYFAPDLCLVVINTLLFVSMIFPWIIDKQFANFNHCFESCTMPFDQLVLLILCLHCFCQRLCVLFAFGI